MDSKLCMWETFASPFLAHELVGETDADQSRARSVCSTDHSSLQTRYKKIMLTYDGSPLADKALEVALELAQQFKAKLLIVGVEPLPPQPGITDLQKRIDQARERFSSKFYAIRLNGMNDGLQVETMLVLGKSGELTRYNAARFHARLIVMGIQRTSSNEGD
jgi:nucleotide-binding universal stress UspA family protein